MIEYKIAKRILNYKERHELSYKSMGALLECEGSSLHYLLTQCKESLAFHVVDKFELLEKSGKVLPTKKVKEDVAEDEAWSE